MLYTIVKKCSSYDEEDESTINVQEIINDDIAKLPKEEAKAKKRMLIKGKIQSVAKMNKMFAVLKEQSELMKSKGLLIGNPAKLIQMESLDGTDLKKVVENRLWKPNFCMNTKGFLKNIHFSYFFIKNFKF